MILEEEASDHLFFSRHGFEAGVSYTLYCKQFCLYQSYRMAQTRGYWFSCVKKVVVLSSGVARLQRKGEEEMYQVCEQGRKNIQRETSLLIGRAIHAGDGSSVYRKDSIHVTTSLCLFLFA